jgi:hypothetical protein
MIRTSARERIARAVANEEFGQMLTDSENRLIGSPLARDAKVRLAELSAHTECPVAQFRRLSGHELL